MKGKRILIADDDAEDRELMLDILLDHDEHVDIILAVNGSEVLDLLEKGPLPDVIVLDYNMPLMNGAELLVRICGDERYKNIPVVIVSTSNAQRHVDECLKVGARYYYVKPADITELHKLAQTILDCC